MAAALEDSFPVPVQVEIQVPVLLRALPRPIPAIPVQIPVPLAPQPRYGHLDYNPSKAMVQEARYAAIEYENSLLLGKMRRIMSVGTAATNKGVYTSKELAPR